MSSLDFWKGQQVFFCTLDTLERGTSAKTFFFGGGEGGIGLRRIRTSVSILLVSASWLEPFQASCPGDNTETEGKFD